MLNTSTFTPNVLTHDQVAELQAIFDQVCGEFEIGPDDREYRDRIAESLRLRRLVMSRTRPLKPRGRLPAILPAGANRSEQQPRFMGAETASQAIAADDLPC